MSDIVNLEKQDLINLSKVLSIDSSVDSPYIYDGVVRSSYQRKEKLYRLHINDSDDVYLFIFNKNNKPVGITHTKLSDFNIPVAVKPKLIDNTYRDIEVTSQKVKL